MTHSECEQLLTEHDVKPTSNRIMVLKALDAAGGPLTLSELETRLLSVDKSGIFRALQLFREHHLVHAVEDTGSGLHYELCRSHSHDHDDDLHAHFYCENCGRTFCLEGVPVPEVDVPQGFMPQSATYMIKGTCPQCSESRNH